jgi:two-component system chemotaxis sensor kinase CheA
MSDYLDPANEELLKDFFEEAQSQVALLEQNILALENDPENREAVDEIFRAAHTLKGGAATVEMTELAEFTHIIEDVLDQIRDDKLTVDDKVVDILLKAIDITRTMLEERLSGGVYQDDTTAIEDALHSLKSSDKSSTLPAAKDKSAGKAAPAGTGDLTEYELLELKGAADPGSVIYLVRVSFNEDNPMNSVGGVQVFAALKEVGTILQTKPDFNELLEDNFFPIIDYYLASMENEEKIKSVSSINEVVNESEIKVLTIEETAEAEPVSIEQEIAKQAEAKKADPAKKTLAYGSVLRVESNRIDLLLNLVSETIITKATFNLISDKFSEILQGFQQSEILFREKLNDLFYSLSDNLVDNGNGDSVGNMKRMIAERSEEILNIFNLFHGNLKENIDKFRNTAQSLGRITTDLQEGVMQIRMVPISQLFSRFPRLVRDLAHNLGKDVKLIIEGEDTELDKSVVEDLVDPLVHCVRNSLDHGVEIPEERIKAGKDTRGKIELSAHNEGNLIVIKISDDGKGIDVNSIRRKAVEGGIIHPNKNLSDIEAFNLIFEAGFSTANKITNVSGRGVGLNVVKKQVEKLNGSVSIWSEVGKGSTFTIKLPLTLAIIQGMLIRVGKEIYAIPVSSVIESLRLKTSDIKMLEHYEVFDLRDDVLSLIRLDRLFQIETEQKGNYRFIIVVGTEEKKVGLMVDSLIGEEDVVIKPLKDRYTNSPGIAGATILGDGTVSLILDVGQLLDYGLKSGMDERKEREMAFH